MFAADVSKARKRIFEVIERSKSGDTASSIFDTFIIVLIVLNIVAITAASFYTFAEDHAKLLWNFEVFSIIIFTGEYLLRFWTAPEKYPQSKFSYLKYIFSFMAIIDICAILPFYLPIVISFDFRFIRILRLFRLLRILKLNRYNNSLNIIGRVLRNEKEKLFMTVFIIVIMLLLSSSFMYYIENTVQPEKFPNIISALWWAVATLTTVGYGDVYPVTNLGKLLSGIIAVLGIGLVALPSGIISSGLINEVSRKDKEKIICPHCGKEIEPGNK